MTRLSHRARFAINRANSYLSRVASPLLLHWPSLLIHMRQCKVQAPDPGEDPIDNLEKLETALDRAEQAEWLQQRGEQADT